MDKVWLGIIRDLILFIIIVLINKFSEDSSLHVLERENHCISSSNGTVLLEVKI